MSSRWMVRWVLALTLVLFVAPMALRAQSSDSTERAGISGKVTPAQIGQAKSATVSGTRSALSGLAAEQAAILIDSLTLLAAIIATLLAGQLYGLMKGGEMVAAWRYLAGAAIFFGVSKILQLAQALYPDWHLGNWVVELSRLVCAIFLCMGFWSQKRILG